MTHRNPLIFPILLLLLLISFTLSAANWNTCAAFGTKTINTISETASITQKPEQLNLTFHWQITVIRIPTIHHPQCRRHGYTIHGPQGNNSGDTILKIIPGTQY